MDNIVLSCFLVKCIVVLYKIVLLLNKSKKWIFRVNILFLLYLEIVLVIEDENMSF